MIINTDKINKLKRHKVVRGLNFIDAINHGFDEPLIEKVILFGSSITEDCHEDSDVDICLVSKYDCTHMGFFRYSVSFLSSWTNCVILSYIQT